MPRWVCLKQATGYQDISHLLRCGRGCSAKGVLLCTLWFEPTGTPSATCRPATKSSVILQDGLTQTTAKNGIGHASSMPVSRCNRDPFWGNVFINTACFPASLFCGGCWACPERATESQAYACIQTMYVLASSRLEGFRVTTVVH